MSPGALGEDTMKLAKVCAALWAVLGTVAIGCAVPTQAAPMVLHRANGAEPDTLDPAKATGVWENNIIGDMFIGLMTEDVHGQPVLGAAASYSVSPDGLVYTFKLRGGMTWSDGTPLTAADFVYSLRRLFDPKTASPYASILYPIKNAMNVNAGLDFSPELGVRALNEETLQITLAHPTPYFLSLLTHTTAMPVPRRAIEQFGDAWTKPDHIVVDGPYKLAQWVPNSIIRLTKNPRFYDAAHVAIGEVDYYPVADSSTVLKRFRAGDFDITNDFPAREYQVLKAGGYAGVTPSEVHVYPYVATTYVQFNVTRPPFDSAKVRRALSEAIDRKILTAKLLGDGEVPAYALVPPHMAHYENGPQLDFKNEPLAERQADAKRLLAEAGFSAAHPLKLTFRYRNRLDTKRVATAVAAMWKEVGVEAQLLSSDPQVHYNALRTGNFEVADAGWVADYNDAQNFLYLLQSNSGAMNYGRYSNPAFDALMKKADQTQSLAAREALLKQAEAIALRDEPLIPLFYGVSRALVKSYVKGYDDNTLGWHRTRYMSLAPH
jgi:oligopeptide transport system substrate-binding protein